MGFLPKFRFLPVTIFFATLMLTVKIGDIWSGIDGMSDGSINVSDAGAQVTPEEVTAETPQEEASTLIDDAPLSAEDESEYLEEAVTSKLVTNDPTLMTTAEIDLLQKLSSRREEIEKREREMDIRDGLLKAAEDRINKKIVELQQLQVTIDGLITKFDEQQDSKLLSLVKIYENMKPKDAATIFEDLELDTLLLVAERMKERKLAPVMAKMNPQKAREMTVELRRMRELPAVRG